MNHRARVSKDTQKKRWTGECDCSANWSATRWRAAFDEAFTHVRGARRIRAIGGTGFNLPKGRDRG